jgi:TRAP-type uncharacterized transport system substrate-binding protein
MMSRVPRLQARRRSDYSTETSETRGPRRAPLSAPRRVRAIWLAGFALALSAPAFAEDPAPADKSNADTRPAAAPSSAPHGMVRYPKPLVRNGKTILWHGAWREGGKSAEHLRPGRAAAAQPAQNTEPAPAAKVPAPRAFSILADGSDPTAIRLAGELAGVMSGDDAQVKAASGWASRAALAKAVNADSADFAIVPLDSVVDPVQSGPDWRRRAPYVARLSNEEIELIAPKAIADIKQLAGRNVNVGPVDSAGAASAANIFSKLSVAANWTNYPLSDALQLLKDGKIDAAFVLGGKDSDSLAKFGDDGRFHLVAIPYSPALRAYYCPERASAEDWPKLIASTEKVDTLAAPMALIAIDGFASDRAQRMTAPAGRFFANFDHLLDDSKDADWRDVNLAARIEQLPRFGAAQAWLDQNKGDANADFDEFRAMAQSADGANGGPSGADSDRLYQSLMRLSGQGQ